VNTTFTTFRYIFFVLVNYFLKKVFSNFNLYRCFLLVILATKIENWCFDLFQSESNSSSRKSFLFTLNLEFRCSQVQICLFVEVILTTQKDQNQRFYIIFLMLLLSSLHNVIYKWLANFSLQILFRASHTT